MKRKIAIVTLPTILLLSVVIISIATTRAENGNEIDPIEEAIEIGIAWLAERQGPDYHTEIPHNLIQEESINYTKHDPIFINGSKDFRTTAETENWAGNGTLSAPFVLNELNIVGSSSSNLIEIRNIDESIHFHISYCILNGGINGFHLEKTINVVLSNNFVFNNKKTGMYLSQIENCILVNNTIFNNTVNGIELHSSNKNRFFGNYISNNNKSGILLDNSENNTLTNNAVSRNLLHGVELYSSTQNNLSANILSSNSKNGICSSSSEKTSLYSNIISGNCLYGISILSYSAETRVEWNDFVGNNVEGNSQALDNCWELDNGFIFNYFKDHVRPDRNGDGFVDFPYKIDVFAANQDLFPLNSSYFIVVVNTDNIQFNTNTGTQKKTQSSSLGSLFSSNFIIGSVLLVIFISWIIFLIRKQLT